MYESGRFALMDQYVVIQSNSCMVHMVSSSDSLQERIRQSNAEHRSQLLQ